MGRRKQHKFVFKKGKLEGKCKDCHLETRLFQPYVAFEGVRQYKVNYRWVEIMPPYCMKIKEIVWEITPMTNYIPYVRATDGRLMFWHKAKDGMMFLPEVIGAIGMPKDQVDELKIEIEKEYPNVTVLIWTLNEFRDYAWLMKSRLT